MAQVAVRANSAVFSQTGAGVASVNYINGGGSIFTIVATGTSGQTATVSGSIDNVNWVQLSMLAVTANPDWTVIQHTFPYLKVDGTATVNISRGAA